MRGESKAGVQAACKPLGCMVSRVMIHGLDGHLLFLTTCKGCVGKVLIFSYAEDAPKNHLKAICSAYCTAKVPRRGCAVFPVISNVHTLLAD
jgi:hypothetical protein